MTPGLSDVELFEGSAEISRLGNETASVCGFTLVACRANASVFAVVKVYYTSYVIDFTYIYIYTAIYSMRINVFDLNHTTQRSDQNQDR